MKISSNRKKLLIIGPAPITLGRILDMLKDRFSVDAVLFRKGSGMNYFLDILKILKGTLWADVTLSHFAGRHAFWAVLFARVLRRKSIVMVAGYEVAKEPEINYGLMLKPKKGWVVTRVLRHADRVFAVSVFTRREILSYVPNKDVRVIYGCNAIDPSYFKPAGEKENLVLTVGVLADDFIKRKGFETFLKTAEYLPEIKFLLLGRRPDDTVKYLESIAPPNVTFGDDADLIKWYQRAKVYCQLSYYESFGVCLIEAMACECVPVITDKGALPEVAGDTAFYVPYGDAKATAEAIEKALKSGNGTAARERVKVSFSAEDRGRDFANEIEQVFV